jgi:hypothetical protein
VAHPAASARWKANANGTSAGPRSATGTFALTDLPELRAFLLVDRALKQEDARVVPNPGRRWLAPLRRSACSHESAT